jgi:hypothetical protein
MDPDRLLQMLEDALLPWAKERGGAVSIATDPFNFLELLAQSPSGWRVVLNWAGDDIEVKSAIEGAILTNRVEVGLQASLGLAADRGAAIHRRRAAAATKTSPPSLLALVADARAKVRSLVLSGNDNDNMFHFTGTKPVTMPEGTPLAAYVLQFEITLTTDPLTAFHINS